MPRKPTPTILDETPAEEATGPEAVLELTPEPELVKETVTQVVDEATGEMMEVTKAEMVETSPEGLRIEDINIVEVIENTASGVAGTVVETFEVQDIPVPAEDEVGKAASPLFKPMRSILLAGLGLASYAIEESMFVIGKLVERGELTQKEGAKLVAEMSKKAKMQLPSMPSLPGMPGRKHKEAAEAEEALDDVADEEAVAENAEDVRVETVDVPEMEEAEDQAPEEEEEEVDGMKNNVFITLNLFSGGSTIRLPRVKKQA
jgi:polyhydroxyalkanoate synthesis regulator phasin